jgi:hypothetical protein
MDHVKIEPKKVAKIPQSVIKFDSNYRKKIEKNYKLTPKSKDRSVNQSAFSNQTNFQDHSLMHADKTPQFEDKFKDTTEEVTEFKASSPKASPSDA